jgi:hypothetical protein
LNFSFLKNKTLEIRTVATLLLCRIPTFVLLWRRSAACLLWGRFTASGDRFSDGDTAILLLLGAERLGFGRTIISGAGEGQSVRKAGAGGRRRRTLLLWGLAAFRGRRSLKQHNFNYCKSRMKIRSVGRVVLDGFGSTGDELTPHLSLLLQLILINACRKCTETLKIWSQRVGFLRGDGRLSWFNAEWKLPVLLTNFLREKMYLQLTPPLSSELKSE